MYRADGGIVKGLNPRNDWIPVSTTRPRDAHAVEWYVEAAANPTVLTGFRPTDLGDRLTTSADPLYALARADLCRRETEVAELVADLEVARRARSLPPRRPARRARSSTPSSARSTPSTSATWSAPRRPARARLADVLRAPAATGCAHGLGRRPRAHRLRLAVAGARDRAQGRPHRRQRRAAHGHRRLAGLRDVAAPSSRPGWRRRTPSSSPASEGARRRRDASCRSAGCGSSPTPTCVGGEAMARQFVLGKRFFAEELGVEPREVWLPDSFGYTAALPQIVDAGRDALVPDPEDLVEHDQPLPAPHLLVGGHRRHPRLHPLPAGRHLQRRAVRRRAGALGRATSATRAPRRGRSRRSATATAAAARPARCSAAARRTADLEGSPRVARGDARGVLRRRRGGVRRPAPVWTGELYLEFHRGTYTSQAATKRRQPPQRAPAARGRAVVGDGRGARAARLPVRRAAQRLGDGAAAPVPRHPARHRRSRGCTARPRATYARVMRRPRGDHRARARRSRRGRGRAGRASTPRRWPGSASRRWARRRPPTTAWPRPRARPRTAARCSRTTCSACAVDGAGVIRSILDLRHDREVLPPGRCRQPAPAPPRPPEPLGRLGHRRALPAHGHAAHRPGRAPGRGRRGGRCDGRSGPRRSSSGSHCHLGRIEIDTDVDWHEREKVLKLAVRLDVHADRAASEIQFGHVVRPTHANTSWDAARFEVCAHRWVHVAEAGYGVALANDTTYGHDVTRHPRPGGGTTHGCGRRCCARRSSPTPTPTRASTRSGTRSCRVPTSPTPRAPATASTCRCAAERAARSSRSSRSRATRRSSRRSSSPRTGRGDVVVRLYEPLGARARVRVTPSFETSGAEVVDLLERPLDERRLGRRRAAPCDRSRSSPSAGVPDRSARGTPAARCQRVERGLRSAT